VRPFSGSCGQNSIRAGNWPFRASQLSLRAGEIPSVRQISGLCEEKSDFRWFWRNLSGQKEPVSVAKTVKGGGRSQEP